MNTDTEHPDRNADNPSSGWGAVILLVALVILFILFWTATPRKTDGNGSPGNATGDSGPGSGQGGNESKGSAPRRSSQNGDVPSQTGTENTSGNWTGETPSGTESAAAQSEVKHSGQGEEKTATSPPSSPPASPIQWTPEKKTTPDNAKNWETACSAVLRQIKIPENAVRFPEFGVPNTAIRKTPDDKIEVTGFFEASEPKGGKRIHSFSVTITEHSITVVSIE